MPIGESAPGSTQLGFLVSTGIVYLALLAHAVRVRGLLIGGGFFLFAALIAAAREVVFGMPGKTQQAYTFLVPLRVLGVPVLGFVGWSITAYLAWCVAEAALVRWPRAGIRLFPTLAVAYMVAVAVSLAVEPTGVSAGLWSWRRFGHEDVIGFRRIVGSYWLIALFWAFFSARILGAYWLFFGSEWRRRLRRWLAVLFIVGPPAIGFVFRSALAPERPLVRAGFAVLILLMAFVVPIRFQWSSPPSRGRLAMTVPIVAGFAMTGVLLWIDLVSLGRPDLAATKVPLAVLLALALVLLRGRPHIPVATSLALIAGHSRDTIE